MAIQRFLLLLLTLNVLFPICFTDDSHNMHEEAMSDGISPIFITPEMYLHAHLFPRDEQKRPQPQRFHPHYERPVQVNLTIALISIVDIEPQNEVIIINANFEQSWFNPSMSWDPHNFAGIKKINVRSGMTWVPDIFVHANVENDKKYNGLMDKVNTYVKVNHEGLHTWNAAVTLRMGCGMNIENYPFDTQKCPLRFGSLSMDATRMKLVPKPINLKSYGASPEWIFISMDHVGEEKSYPGSDHPHTTAVYTVAMRRKALYPITMLILPNLILAGLTILVFSIPTPTGERAMYIFTIFLAVAWYMTSNIETMPSSSQTIPLYTKFLAINLISLSLLCISLCFTIVCFYTDPQISDMPGWIRVNILGHGAKFFGMDVDKKVSEWREELCEARQYDHLLPEEYEPDQEGEVQAEEGNEKAPGDLWVDCSKPEAGALMNIFNPVEMRQVHLLIEDYLRRLEEIEDSKWAQREWELVAQILDKAFLYVFSSALTLTVVSCSIHILNLDGY